MAWGCSQLPYLYWVGFPPIYGARSLGRPSIGHHCSCVFFGFPAWNTYHLFDIKPSNIYLAADESAWGFGQVLPVVPLGLILLNVLDSVQSECLASMPSGPREDAELE